MKIVKRVVSLAVVALGVCTSLTWAAPLQEISSPEDFETDTLGLLTDSLPLVERPANLVPAGILRERFAKLQQRIPLVYHEVSHQFVEYFIYTKPDFTRRMMEQKNLYFPIYEKALARHKMPDELKYLSMIESGLNPRIISYAGAGGLWQFMRATGREFGLRQDAYVDERFDPEKSTEAACRYLQQLYRIFGDWEMALASYNCGPGNVKRAMRRSGGDSFWTIYNALPKQTRSYVPQFVAIMYMMHYGEDHGISPQHTEFPVITDTIQVNGYFNLATFASLSGVTMEEIQSLNPQIINTSLPDYTRGFSLKVPAQKFAVMQPDRPAILDSASKRGSTSGTVLASLDSETEYITRQVRHTVRRGETLSSVSRRYGVGINDLKRWNKMRSTKLAIGQRLTIVRQVRSVQKPKAEVQLASVEKAIPVAGKQTEENETEADDVIEPDAEATEGDQEPTETRVARVTRPQPAAKTATYAVRRGDNLTTIARRHGIAVRDLIEWNDLASGRIMPGQKLRVGKGESTPPATTLAVAKSTKPATSQIKPRYHTVQRGDTLWTISQRYGLTIDKLKQANKIKSNTIKAGMKLLISG